MEVAIFNEFTGKVFSKIKVVNSADIIKVPTCKVASLLVDCKRGLKRI